MRATEFTLMVAGFLAASAVGGEAAELAAMGIYDQAVIKTDVASGEVATLSPHSVYSERTTLVKAGAGTLVLPASAFEEGLPSRVQVMEGNVVYSNDLAEVEAVVPTDLSDSIKAKLAFWGSVKDTDHMLLEGEGVEKLFDLREADTNAPTHIYLAAEHVGDVAAPTLMEVVAPHHYSTVTNTCTMAWFGGYGSGVSMKFLQPNGTAYKVRPQEFSVVYGRPWDGSDFGFLLGNCMSTPEHTLWNEGNGLPWASVWGTSSGDVATWVDGEIKDRDRFTGLPGGFHVLHERFNTLYTGESLNNFENALFSTTSTTATKGGQSVGEVLFFTNRLTDVERREVLSYLANKWQLVNKTPARVELAAGTTLEVTAEVGTTHTTDVLATGAGTLVKKGAGTLWLRPQAREAVTPVKVDLQEGDLIASGAFTLKATAGMKVTATPHDGAKDTGVRVSVGSASLANALEKDGTGTVAIDAIPAGTSRVTVNGGTLAIRATAATPARYEVAIPNGRFEDWGAYTGRGNIGVATVGGAWSAQGTVGFYNYDDWTREGGGAYFGGSVKISDYGFNKYPPLDGRCVLMLKVCNTWAEVAVPFAEGGEYELRFLFAGRNGSNKSRMNVILRGADNVDYEIGKTYLKSYNEWTPQVFRFRVPGAGTHRIRFFHLPWPKNSDGTGQQDFTLLVNGLHLYRVGAGGAGWKIPFGDCETTNLAEVATQLDNLTGTTTLPGWTYDTTVESTYARAGLATSRTYAEAGRRYGSAFNATHAPLVGDRQICIRRSGGWVRAVFTPPAGTWYLRAMAATWGERSSMPNQLLATATVGGNTVDLGTMTLPFEWEMRPRTWPHAFTVDGVTPVTLTVTSTCESGRHGANLDNFELVSEMIDDGELVRNGDFESPALINGAFLSARTDWGIVSASGGSSIPREYGRNDSDAFGYDHGSGDAFMEPYVGTRQIRAGFYQDVAFPHAGLYRLSYLTKGRTSVQTIPLDVLLVDTDAAATNRLERHSNHTRGVWEQRTALFRMDGPCTRRLLFLLDGENATGYVCVDDVSIRQVREDVPPTFGTGSDGRLAVSLAAGACLHLDYIGTNTVTSFSVNGKAYGKGVVDQSTCSAILGPGALLVKPHSLVIIFR